MSEVVEKTEQACPRAEIAAYLDGELAPPAETAFEQHLAACEICSFRLNEQKRLLCALNFAFDDERNFELPPDFVKTVTVRAEADVSGLRSGKERRRAIAFALALFIAGVGVGVAGKKTGLLETAAGQIASIAGVFFGFFYNLVFGATVIFRAVSRQLTAGASVYSVLLVALLLVSLAALSLLLTRYHRRA